jgi:hypothetical protein
MPQKVDTKFDLFLLKGKVVSEVYEIPGVCNCVIFEFTDGSKIRILGEKDGELIVKKYQ